MNRVCNVRGSHFQGLFKSTVVSAMLKKRVVLIVSEVSIRCNGHSRESQCRLNDSERTKMGGSECSENTEMKCKIEMNEECDKNEKTKRELSVAYCFVDIGYLELFRIAVKICYINIQVEIDKISIKVYNINRIK